MKFDWLLLKVIHLDVNSDDNSQPFSMYFCRLHRLVLRQLPYKFGEVWLITAKVINELGVKFDWLLLKVIHLDVNSDDNSQPFSMYFCRLHRLVLRQLPCKFGEVWLITAKVINEIFCEIWLSIIESYSFRRQFRRQFSTVSHVVLQALSAGITTTAL